MNHEIQAIVTALEQALQGEPVDSFKRPEFGELIKAVNLVATRPYGCEVVGRRMLQLVLDRMNASMHTERELAIIRGSAGDLC